MKNSYLLYFLLVFISCSSNKTATKQPSSTVIVFLKWYRTNVKSINDINLVNNNGSATVDSTKSYSVDFSATEKYLAALKKSEFISDKYITKWREHFKQCDEDFKANPQFDGPPEAFDFDLVMCSQEYDEDLANIDKAKVIKQETENNSSDVIIEFPSTMKLEYHLSSNNGKWEIDGIQNKPDR